MRIVLVLFVSLLLHGCAAYSDPPFEPIEHAYFKCETSHSLQGGVSGKGPFLRFGPEPGSCKRSEWQRISREQFKALATQWHGKDWGGEIPFWSQP